MLHNDYTLAGGERRSVSEEITGLTARGHTVSRFDVSNEGVPSRQYVTSILLKNHRQAILRAIDDFRPDIVHAQNLFPLLGHSAITAVHDRRIPWVRSLRNYRMRCIAGTMFLKDQPCGRCATAYTGLPGLQHACYRDSRAASASAMAYSYQEHRATKEFPPSAYIVLSKAMEAPLQHLLRDAPIFVKYNSVEQSPAHRTPLPAPARRAFLYVGRLVPEKNVAVLAQITRTRPDITVDVVGDGPERDVLERAAATQPNLRLLGERSQGDVSEMMHAATAVLVPSRWDEPFGRVAAEALAVGTPPLTVRRGGLREIVGFVDRPELFVSDDSSEAWISAIDRVRGLPDGEYESLSQSCLRAWKQHFSPEVATTSLERIYKFVLGRVDDRD